jgi:hypothetical protein
MSIKIPGLNSNVSFDPVGLPFSQVSSVNPLNALTAAYYKLDGTSGPVIDSVAGNNGTNVGATRGVTGKIGDAYTFDGVNDYVNIDAALIPLASTTQGTWNMWVKPVDATPASAEVLIAFSGTTTNVLFEIVITTTGKLTGYCTNYGQKWNFTTNNIVFSDGVWSMVTLVQNGTTVLVYINGVSEPITFANDSDTSYWYNDMAVDNGRLGCLNSNSNGNAAFFNGLIDEPGFFNQGLTSAQITELYNSGDGKTYPY